MSSAKQLLKIEQKIFFIRCFCINRFYCHCRLFTKIVQDTIVTLSLLKLTFIGLRNQMNIANFNLKF